MSKEAIEVIKKESQNGMVEELYLDDIDIGIISPELKRELEKLPNLMCLSLNNCGLTSLANFPAKLSLIRLEMMENKFDPKELTQISNIKTLQSLSLGSNTINTNKDLEPLKNLNGLIQLDLSETNLSKNENYRESVFQLIQSLQVLDNLDLNGKEFEYSDDDEDDEDGDDDEDDDDEDLDEDGEGDEDDEDDDDENGEDDEDDEDDEEGDEDDDEDEDEDDEEEDVTPQNKKRK